MYSPMKRILTGILFFIFSQIGYAQSWIDLTQTSINRRQADANEFKEIVTVLQEEIANRSGILPKVSSNFEGSSGANIYLMLEKI